MYSDYHNLKSEIQEHIKAKKNVEMFLTNEEKTKERMNFSIKKQSVQNECVALTESWCFKGIVVFSSKAVLKVSAEQKVEE